MISEVYSDYFDYLLLDNNKVLVMHTNSDCSLQWTTLNLNVIKLADEKQAQKILLTNKLTTYRNTDSVNSKILFDGFELQAFTSMLDIDLSPRKGIYRYFIKDDLVKRVQPAANNPRDFVDEWIIKNDQDMITFSVKEKLDKLLRIRDELKDRSGFYENEVTFCKKEALYQVVVTFNGNDQNERYYRESPTL